MLAANIAKFLAARLWFELTDKIRHFVRGKNDKAVGLSSTSIGCHPAQSFEETHLNFNEPLGF